MDLKIFIPLSFIAMTFLSCGIKANDDGLNLKKMDSKELKEFIEVNIDTLQGSNLSDFIYYIEQSNINFSNYNETLKSKFKKSIYPYDLHLISSILIENESNREILEEELSKKITLWDVGDWGNKFWEFIQKESLDIDNPHFYSFKDGVKVYSFDEFMKTKKKTGELGVNPLLFINDSLVSYENGSLNSILEQYEIIQIDYIPIKKSTSLFGKRGIDGKISIKTN